MARGASRARPNRSRPYVTRRYADEIKDKKYELYKMHLVRPEKDSAGLLELGKTHPIVGETIYTAQLEALRDRVKGDKEFFYTYSEQHMGLSVDPYTVEDCRKRDAAEHRRKYLTDKGFENVIKKDKNESIRHRLHLHPATVDDLRDCPYHLQKKRVRSIHQTLEMLGQQKKPTERTRISKSKSPKNSPKKSPSRLPRLNDGYFSTYKPLDEEKITAVEAQRRRDEAKNREKEEFKKKLVVEDPTFHVGLKPLGVQVLDKYKGLLSDKPLKPGLVLPQKYLKDKVVARDASLQPLPISYNLAEAKLTKGESEKVWRLEKKFDANKCTAATDFNLVSINPQPSLVYKPSRADAFTHAYT